MFISTFIRIYDKKFLTKKGKFVRYDSNNLRFALPINKEEVNWNATQCNTNTNATFFWVFNNRRNQYNNCCERIDEGKK